MIPQELAARQDIRPLKLLLLNLMPKKHDTEWAERAFGNTPLQIEMILMTTASYTPRNTELAFMTILSSFDDVRDKYFMP